MAAPRAQIEVKGINSLVRAMKQAEDEASVELLKRSNAQAAGIVHQTAVRLSPLLEGSLVRTVRGTASARAGVVRAGNKGVPYAGVIHFGWPRRNIRPQPFLYDAMDSRRDMVIEVYRKNLEAIVRRIEATTGPGAD